jgi:prolyl oligopeptidase
VDTYGPQTVVDPYRWLEELDAPEVRDWVHAQNVRSRAWFAAQPRWRHAHAALREICAAPMRRSPCRVAGRLYLLERHDTAQSVLVCDGRPSYDPNTDDPTGATAIDGFWPSPDGYIAIATSVHGSESSTLRVLDPSGRVLADRRVDLSHTTVAWRGAGFFYTRFRPSGVFFHTLGHDAEREVFVGDSAERLAVQCTPTRVLVVEKRHPAGRMWLDDGTGLREIGDAPFGGCVVLRDDGVHVADDRGHLRFRDGTWTVLDPRATTSLVFTSSGLVRQCGPALFVDDHPVPLDHGRTVHLEPGVTDCAVAVVEAFCTPPTVCEVTATGLRLLFPSVGSEPDVQTVTFVSDTGVPIRMALFGEPAGPVLLTAYGAGGLHYAPTFLPEAAAWLRWGGRVAVASIRSADNETDVWPVAGRFRQMENAYREVVRAAEWVRAAGAPRVAAYGVSHGGLVMAGALVTRPDVFDAVACHVPLTDLFRHPMLSGDWLTSYYGDPRVPGHAEWLVHTSPYQQIRDRVYPPVLMSTGLRDARVHPSHATKFAAALQAVGCRALLTADPDAGHGAGQPLEARVRDLADRITFLGYADRRSRGPAREP